MAQFDPGDSGRDRPAGRCLRQRLILAAGDGPRDGDHPRYLVDQPTLHGVGPLHRDLRQGRGDGHPGGVRHREGRRHDRAGRPGTYQFNDQLTLGTANNLTIVGAGKGKTVLDFHGQKVGAKTRIFAQSVKGLTFQDFTVQDSPGNASRVLDVTGLTFRSVEVKWTSTDSKSHGAYGLYPVQSTNVLIENCTISGASDSGIYVGQSQQIVVRNNEAFANVAGIEIENSFFADVYDNNAHDNTAGILVFDLPGLMQEGGHNIRVYMNTIQSNNTENFAAKGDIVGLVPGGTGFFVMANHDVEVFQNTIVGNKDSRLRDHQLRARADAVHRQELLRVAVERVPARQHVHERRHDARHRSRRSAFS